MTVERKKKFDMNNKGFNQKNEITYDKLSFKVDIEELPLINNFILIQNKKIIKSHKMIFDNIGKTPSIYSF